MQLTVVLPKGKVEPEAGVQLTVGAVPLSSEAETEKVTVPPAGFDVVWETFGGGFGVNVGAVVSLKVTVTVKLALPVLLWLSVAEHVTVVGPTGKWLPDAGVQIGVRAPSTVSVAVTSPSGQVTVIPEWSLVVPPLLTGTETVGGVVSWTMTLNDAGSASAAVQVTSVVPIENCEPLSGVQAAVSSFGSTVTV